MSAPASWHRRLAITLRECGHYEEALEYFQKAIELDPPLWLAHHGIARTYKAMGDTEAHIQYEKRFLTELKDANPVADLTLHDVHSVHERLAEAYISQDNTDDAFESYRAGFAHAPRCSTCLGGIIKVLYLRKSWQEIMSILRTLDSHTPNAVPGKSYSRLVEQLLNSEYVENVTTNHSLLAAAEHTGETAFLIAAHRRALSAARRERRTITALSLEFALAKILSRSSDADEGARMCERLIMTYRGTRVEEQVELLMRFAGIYLANYCLLQIIDSGASSARAARCGGIIERMASRAGLPVGLSLSEADGREPGLEDIGGQYPAEYHQFAPESMGLVLGQYYRFLGREEDARNCFRERLREGLRLLHDDDPWNDTEAWSQVGYVLASVGDEENAKAAWTSIIIFLSDVGFVGPDMAFLDSTEEESEEDESEEEEPKEKPEQAETNSEGKDPGNEEDDGADEGVAEDTMELELDPTMACDGCLEPLVSTDFHICRLCVNIGFCGSCIVKIRAGTHLVRICSSKHDWISFPKMTKKELTAPQNGLMLVGGNWVEFETWVEKLKREWDL